MIDRIRRFKRLLETKELEQGLLQEELGAQEKEKAVLEGLTDRLKKEKETALASFCRDVAGASTIRELWMRRSALDHIGEVLDEGERKLAVAAERVDSTRDRLMHKHREVKTFEVALDDFRNTWRTECLKKEQSLLDDLTASRSGRVKGRVDGA